MKESVVDIHDLQEAAPFFKSRFGTFLGKVLIKWLSIDKVNKAHAHNCHLRGAEFTTALLNDPLIDIKYNLHNAGCWIICLKVLSPLSRTIRSDR